MGANIYYHLSVSGLKAAKFKATDFVFSKETMPLTKNSSIIACWDISPSNWTVHGVSHMLGIDVHDCNDARREQYSDGVLEAGMILTVEPGLYIHPDDELFPAEYRGIGVRIEDDILVTETGCRVLSNKLPSHPDEIEVWISNLTRSN